MNEGHPGNLAFLLLRFHRIPAASMKAIVVPRSILLLIPFHAAAILPGHPIDSIRDSTAASGQECRKSASFHETQNHPVRCILCPYAYFGLRQVERVLLLLCFPSFLGNYNIPGKLVV
jgi:hypothetical protein